VTSNPTTAGRRPRSCITSRRSRQPARAGPIQKKEKSHDDPAYGKNVFESRAEVRASVLRQHLDDLEYRRSRPVNVEATRLNIGPLPPFFDFALRKVKDDLDNEAERLAAEPNKRRLDNLCLLQRMAQRHIDVLGVEAFEEFVAELED